ncbi:MAG: DUF4832 domain-containing protein [Clostridia bacterium]|nr:DUF4832 domain-containing protein [Clostridia bacterium]
MYSFPNLNQIGNPDHCYACGFPSLNDPNKVAYFVDLRAMEDDKAVLKNPHKGWYWHYIDNGYKRDNYRVRHDPADHLEDFPGLHHLYLRYDWGDIEVEEGKYDWSYIDQIMDEWSKYGYKFGMRLVTYEGDGSIPFATPEYVFRKGARCYELPGGRLEPDYGDPIYLEALSRFMEEAGKKFNNDPRVELVDVGTFGTWGEGHGGNGSDTLYSNEVMKQHIDLHVRNFPDKFILLNDDHINARWPVGVEQNMELAAYAAALGLGIDEDSVCVSAYAEWFGYNSLRTPWLFDYFNKNAPIVLEFEHYSNVSPEVFRGGLPFIDAMKRTQATFAGFHGYPRPWLKREPYLTEFCANRLGYWYFLPSAVVPPLALDAPNVLSLNVENRGYAKAYRRFDLKIRLTDEDGKTYTETIADADNRRWLPGQVTEQVCVIRPSGLRAGACDLAIGLFDGETPIKLGLKPGPDKDGFYTICRTAVRELFGK